MMNKIKPALLAIGMALGASGAFSQDANWPQHPVTIVTPAAAGGGADYVVRMFSEKLQERFKQPFVVDNKPGASGVLGLQSAFNAPADGYTFAFGYSSNMIAPRYQFNKLAFDADTDFIPVASLTTNEMVIIGSPKIPGNSFRDFVDYFQKNPKSDSFYGSYGEGSYAHLIGNSISLEYKLGAAHEAYKSGPHLLLAVINNEIPWGILPLPTVKPMVDSGKVKMLAVLSPERSQFAPEVLTMKEQGFPDPVLAFNGFYGLFAKKGTSPAVVKKMETTIVEISPARAFREKFVSASTILVGGKSPEFSPDYKQQVSFYKSLFEKASIKKK